MLSGAKNILQTLDKATSTDYGEGLLSYQRYNAVCGQIAEFYGYTLPEVAAVFAALSPNNDYLKNLRSTVSVIEGHKAGKPVNEIKVSTYKHCRDRAYSYLNGVDFLETTIGPKIRAFYQCILNPEDPFSVTVDGHAVNIWKGEQKPLKEVVYDGGFKYDVVAEDYRAVARLKSLLPNQLQSITWFTWKRIHRIFYPIPQRHLFIDREGDFWRIKVDLADIFPFDSSSKAIHAQRREAAKSKEPRDHDPYQPPLFL